MFSPGNQDEGRVLAIVYLLQGYKAIAGVASSLAKASCGNTARCVTQKFSFSLGVSLWMPGNFAAFGSISRCAAHYRHS